MLDGTSDVRSMLDDRRRGRDPDPGGGGRPSHDGERPVGRGGAAVLRPCPMCGEPSDDGHADGVGRVVALLGELLLDRLDVSDVGAAVLTPCAQVLGPDAEVCLVLRWTDDRGRDVTVRDATTRRAFELLAWQDQHGEGPLQTARELDQTYVVTDCRGSDDRFPRFLGEASGQGVRSCAAFPVVVEGRTRGAMGVLYPVAGAISPALVRAGEELARAVAKTVWNAVTYREVARLADQLTVALAGRSLIERAKGVLMGELGVGEDVAFEILSTQSQHENVKLRQIAARLLVARDGG